MTWEREFCGAKRRDDEPTVVSGDAFLTAVEEMTALTEPTWDKEF
jgi:hypothetical protein